MYDEGIKIEIELRIHRRNIPASKLSIERFIRFLLKI